MQIVDGFLVLSKREVGPGEGSELYVPARGVSGIEPHRTGCYVYVGAQRFDVGHSHIEIIRAVHSVVNDAVLVPRLGPPR